MRKLHLIRVVFFYYVDVIYYTRVVLNSNQNQWVESVLSVLHYPANMRMDHNTFFFFLILLEK